MQQYIVVSKVGKGLPKAERKLTIVGVEIRGDLNTWAPTPMVLRQSLYLQIQNQGSALYLGQMTQHINRALSLAMMQGTLEFCAVAGQPADGRLPGSTKALTLDDCKVYCESATSIVIPEDSFFVNYRCCVSSVGTSSQRCEYHSELSERGVVAILVTVSALFLCSICGILLKCCKRRKGWIEGENKLPIDEESSGSSRRRGGSGSSGAGVAVNGDDRAMAHIEDDSQPTRGREISQRTLTNPSLAVEANPTAAAAAAFVHDSSRAPHSAAIDGVFVVESSTRRSPIVVHVDSARSSEGGSALEGIEEGRDANNVASSLGGIAQHVELDTFNGPRPASPSSCEGSRWLLQQDRPASPPGPDDSPTGGSPRAVAEQQAAHARSTDRDTADLLTTDKCTGHARA